MKNFCLILVTAAFIVAASDASVLEVYFPPEHISNNTGRIFVVGKSSAPNVELLLNNKVTCTLKVADSVFHGAVSFGYGLNEIMLKNLFEEASLNMQLDDPLEILYGPEGSAGFMQKRLYPEYLFHDSASKKACIGCHSTAQESLEECDDGSACAGCHKNMMEKFTRHTKVEDRTCINCHNLGKDLMANVTAENYLKNPCFSCHREKRGMFEKNYLHGPVAGGSCTICHNPHGSPYEKNLNQPVQILCTSCHTDIEDELTNEVVHNPFKNGRCTKCHDPHSTNNRWVLVKNSEEICMECHDMDTGPKWHQHPYNVVPKRELNVPLKLTSKGRLECISCHNPHSTNTEHLLRIDQDFTCKGCHSDML